MKLARKKSFAIIPILLLYDSLARFPHANATNDELRLSTSKSHPYFAQLSNDQGPFCGGILVASDVLLTAAHCLNQNDDILAEIGSETLHVLSSSVVTHPSYFYNTYTGGIDADPFDIALLPLNGHSNASIAKLGQALEPSTNDLIGLSSQSNDGFVSLQYVPNEICIQSTGVASNGQNISYANQIIDVSFCAFGPLCRGDSGGPILDEDGSVVAIISANYGCSHPTLPTLNVRISAVREWIKATTCNLSAHQTGSCPTAAPSRSPSLVFTIVIQLDDYPSETGFCIESGDGFRYQAYPGTFPENQANSLVVVSVDAPFADGYYFVMTDNEHDGIEGGFYQVWLGPAESGTLLVEGSGDFYLEERRYFELPIESQSPTTTAIPAGGSHASGAHKRSGMASLSGPMLLLLICLNHRM